MSVMRCPLSLGKNAVRDERYKGVMGRPLKLVKYADRDDPGRKKKTIRDERKMSVMGRPLRLIKQVHRDMSDRTYSQVAIEYYCTLFQPKHQLDESDVMIKPGIAEEILQNIHSRSRIEMPVLRCPDGLQFSSCLQISF